MREKFSVRPEFALAAGLAAATLVAFQPAWTLPFVNFDDDIYVTNNPWVRAGLTWDGLLWALQSFDFNWHPLTWLSHMTDAELYGLNAGGHHYTSVLLHVANTLLLFAVLVRMTGRRRPSAVVAAWFALHPLHVEAVAWIAARKDVLSTCFWLLTMRAYVRYARRPNARAALLVASCLALGLASKAMLVTLPCVLLLLDYWPLGRIGPLASGSGAARDRAFAPAPAWQLVAEKLPLFAISAAACVAAIVAQSQVGAVGSLRVLPLSRRLANAVLAYVIYLRKTVWPENLAVLYPLARGVLPAWEIAAATALLAFLSALALRECRRRPYLTVGWFWYVGTLVPVIGLVQIGQQALADRYTYVSLIGIFIAVAWSAEDLAARCHVPGRARNALALATVVVLMPLTRAQLRYWRSSEVLFRHAVAVTSDNFVAHTNLAVALADGGETDAALREYERGLRIAPHDATIHRSLGFALERAGRLEEAAGHFSEALRLRPDDAVAHYGMGIVRNRQSQFEAAAEHLLAAIEAQPSYARAHSYLAGVRLRQGEPDDAVSHARTAVRISPYDARAHNALGTALAALGHIKVAAVEFERAVSLDPKSRLARRNLAIARRQLSKKRHGKPRE